MECKMAVNSFTTEEILKLEDTGGVLTSGIAPKGLMNAPLHKWLSSMPQVDTELVIAWYNAYISRVALEKRLTELGGAK